MATNMAPHNLAEICNAICAYIDNPEITIEELMQFVEGPDFPTGAIIFGRQGIKDACMTGRGKILVRGRFTVETSKGGKETIVFTEIPYNVNKKHLLEKIGELVRDKIIDGISDFNDESDRDGIRVVVGLKRGSVLKAVLHQLFMNTQLQTSFGIINLALVKGRPQCLNLKELIHYFVEHRIEVVTRRTRYDLRKAEERAHILEGLVIALSNIEEVVAIIKASRDINASKEALQKRFLLSEVQAQAIVDMRLGRLTSLEVEKLQKELEELKTQIVYYKSLLEDQGKLRKLIQDEIRSISERYGDKRRTEIVDTVEENINIEELIKKEEMIILISRLGYIKRAPVSVYRNQGRGGKGMAGVKLMEDDFVEQIFVASTHEYIMFITSVGKAYWLKVHELPEGSRTSKGTHVKSILSLTSDENISAIAAIKEFSANQFLFMGTARGVIKKVSLDQFSRAKTRGIIALRLDEGDTLVSAMLSGGKDEVMLISQNGRALRASEESVRAMGRAGRGVTGIKLGADDKLIGILRVSKDEDMLLITEYGYGKRVKFDEFSKHGRGTGGQKIYTVSEKTGGIVGAVTTLDDEEIMCITGEGKSIKLKVSTIRVMGRSAGGVRILAIDKPDAVIGVDRIVKEEG
jgi:DNA gyrase subunit A